MLLDESPDSCWRGSHSLLEVISQELGQRGLPVESEGSQVLVDSLQDALGLVFDALGMGAGDRVVVEDPASLALRSVVIARGLVPQVIKRTPDHLEIYTLAAAATHQMTPAGVKAIVVTSNFHDPTGGVLSPHERTQLLSLAGELDVPLIEIDPFPGSFFGEVFQTPISALDGLDRTIYISDVGSLFSNTFHHHVICARPEFVRGLVRRRALAHGRATVWEQAVLQDLWTRGCHRKQVIRLQRLLRERRDLLHGMLTRMAPADIRWSVPLGGIHMWLEFPVGRKNIRSVFDGAVSDGVVLARGEFFGFSRGYENCLRLNFARFEPVQTYADLKCLFGKWAAAPDLAKEWAV
jgi:DNA-binding transcriptional MocR family regulator